MRRPPVYHPLTASDFAIILVLLVAALGAAWGIGSFLLQNREAHATGMVAATRQ